MKIDVNEQEIIETLEINIIDNNQSRIKNSESKKSIYQKFILLGQINMAYKIGVIDKETAQKYISVLYGRYDKEIAEIVDVENLCSDSISLVSLYDELTKQKEQ